MAISSRMYKSNFALAVDREIALAFLKKGKWNFTVLSPKFTYDQNFILEAVKINGAVLQYISNDLKYAPYQDNEEIVLKAIQTPKSNDIPVIRYASDRLKHDREIVLAALKQNKHSFYYIPDEFLSDQLLKQNYLSSG
jgi:Domain of unknown function (DUF4116)